MPGERLSLLKGAFRNRLRGLKARGPVLRGVRVGYNAPMENSAPISRRDALDRLCFVIGMALFWPMVSYRIAPAMLMPGYELPVSATYDALGALGALSTVAVALVLAAALAHGRIAGPAVRWGVLGSGLVTLALLAASSFAGGGNVLVDALATLSAAVYACLLAAGWAAGAASFSPRFAVLACAFSLALNIVLVAAVQAMPLPVDLGRASRASLLAFFSGALLVFQRPMAAPPGAVGPGSGTSAGAGRAASRSTATPTTPPSPIFHSGADQTAGRPKGEGLFGADGALLFRAFRSSSLAWMFALLVLYLAFTTVIRTVMSFGFDFEEPLYKSWFSKVVLLLFSLVMFAVALRMNRSGASGGTAVSFPWLGFVVSCLAVLYFAIVFAGYAPLLCHEIIFPSRLYAFFLLWVVALVLAFAAGCRPDVAVCLLFLPALGMLRFFGCLVAFAMPSVTFGSAATMALYVATAFAVTVATFLYLRAAFSERAAGAHGETVAGAGGDFAGAGAGASASSAAADRRAAVCRRLGAERGCTEREVEVLVLLSEGHGQKRIAQELFLSPNTIHSYVKSLYRKLDVHDRQEVIDLVRAAESDAAR